MRTIFKGLLIFLGLAVVATSIAFSYWVTVQVNHLWDLAGASNQDPADPLLWLVLSAAVTLLGGLILGFGLGWPRRGYKQGLQAQIAASAVAIPTAQPDGASPPAPDSASWRPGQDSGLPVPDDDTIYRPPDPNAVFRPGEPVAMTWAAAHANPSAMADPHSGPASPTQTGDLDDDEGPGEDWPYQPM